MANSSDNFTDTNGTLAEDHTLSGGSGKWTKDSSWTAVVGEIQSNQMTEKNGNFGAFYAPDSPGSAEYDVQATMQSSAGCGGPACRISVGNSTLYHPTYSDGAAEYRYRMENAGTPSTLGTYSGTAPTAATVFKNQCRDAAKKLLLDGVERISTTNNDIAAAGEAGFVIFDVNEFLDDWSSTDAGATVYERTVSSSVAMLDADGQAGLYLRAPLDDFAVDDLLGQWALLSRRLADYVEGVPDSVVVVLLDGGYRQLTDVVAAGDALATEALQSRTAGDSLAVADALSRLLTLATPFGLPRVALVEAPLEMGLVGVSIKFALSGGAATQDLEELPVLVSLLAGAEELEIGE